MKTLWKEWCQQKWLFVLFCITGISFPILDVITNWPRYGKIHSDYGSAVVVGLGVLFAIILSIATTNSDVKKGVDNFLLSRPVRVHKLFITKIVLAAVLLFIAFLFVSSLDFASASKNHRFPSFAWTAICYTYPVALMLFAVTMFLVVLLRDTAKAVLMAIWVTLMVYFLPLLVSGLEWMNIVEHLSNHQDSLLTHLLNQRLNANYPWQNLFRYLFFVGAMTGISIVFLVITIKAVKNRWRWHPGQKTIVWTIGLSAAFIFGVAMFQVGHNLEFVTTHKNREIYPKKSLREKTENKYNWTDETISDDYIDRNTWRSQSTICVKDDLMFKVSIGSQIDKEFLTADPDRPGLEWKTPLKQHFFLDIYHLPYINESFHLSETRFFITKPISRKYTQYTFGSIVRNDRLYVAYRPQSPDPQLKTHRTDENPFRFLVVDVSDPSAPQRISDTEISRPVSWNGTMTNYNEYCYINEGDQLLILSVAEHDKPEIVRQIDLKQKWPSFPDRQISVVDNKLICNDGWQIAMFDLTNPLEPEIVFYETFKEKEEDNRQEDIGAIACDKDIIYIAKESGIFVYELTEDEKGNLASDLIGRRRTTPLEKYAGRKPKELLFYNGYLVENASSFGVLVYDVSDLTRPRRAFHGNTPNHTSDIGIWNGLFYMENYGNDLVFLDIPKAKK